MYQYGRGVAQNDVEAVNWYRKAADQGNYNADFRLKELLYTISMNESDNNEFGSLDTRYLPYAVLLYLKSPHSHYHILVFPTLPLVRGLL